MFDKPTFHNLSSSFKHTHLHTIQKHKIEKADFDKISFEPVHQVRKEFVIIAV